MKDKVLTIAFCIFAAATVILLEVCVKT